MGFFDFFFCYFLILILGGQDCFCMVLGCAGLKVCHQCCWRSLLVKFYGVLVLLGISYSVLFYFIFNYCYFREKASECIVFEVSSSLCDCYGV